MLNGGQEPADLDGPTRARILLTRRFALTVGWKLLAVIAIDFLSLRIWAPNLINLHQDLALLAAIACLLLALAATSWLAFQLWIDGKRFALARRAIPRARPYTIET
jgi:hypothetical protein